MSRATLARKVMFQCLHRYEVSDWSVEKNTETFGPCYTETSHGHNYELVGFFSGAIDQETGMIINLKDVDDILKQSVSVLDGKFLNQDVEEFKSKVPTTENLISFLAGLVQEKVQDFENIQLSKLRLYETDNLWVDWINEPS